MKFESNTNSMFETKRGYNILQILLLQSYTIKCYVMLTLQNEKTNKK